MAQTTILAAGTTAATSTDVVVAAGASVTIGVFTSAAGGLPGNHHVSVLQVAPSGTTLAFSLSGNTPQAVIAGPGTFRAQRHPGLTTPIGVYTDA